MKYSELFFLSSKTQSNIYNLSIVPDGKNNLLRKIIVFYLKPKFQKDIDFKHNGDIICISNSENVIHATQKPLEFSNIHASSEVVTIDTMFEEKANRISIILGLIKKDTKTKALIHIYELQHYNTSSDLSKSILVFKKDVSFNPLCIKNSKVYYGERLTPSFIVSVSDEPISHTNKDKISPLILTFVRQSSRSGDSIGHDPNGGLKEKKGLRYFDISSKKRTESDDYGNRLDEHYNQKFLQFNELPEANVIKEKVIYFDICIEEDNKKRIGLFGMHSGKFMFTVTDLITGEILHQFTGQHTSPITYVQLVSSNQWLSNKIDNLKNDYHTLICTSLEKACVFRNIIESNGFQVSRPPSTASTFSSSTSSKVTPIILTRTIGNQYILTDSSEYDIVTCATIADIDLDGQLELLIGTYQQRLLIYKWISCPNNTASFKLVAKLKCAGPIFSIRYEDVTNDGLREIIVLTSHGIHIFQVDLSYVQDLISKQLGM